MYLLWGLKKQTCCFLCDFKKEKLEFPLFYFYLFFVFFAAAAHCQSARL